MKFRVRREWNLIEVFEIEANSLEEAIQASPSYDEGNAISFGTLCRQKGEERGAEIEANGKCKIRSERKD